MPDLVSVAWDFLGMLFSEEGLSEDPLYSETSHNRTVLSLSVLSVSGWDSGQNVSLQKTSPATQLGNPMRMYPGRGVLASLPSRLLFDGLLSPLFEVSAWSGSCPALEMPIVEFSRHTI